MTVYSLHSLLLIIVATLLQYLAIKVYFYSKLETNLIMKYNVDEEAGIEEMGDLLRYQVLQSVTVSFKSCRAFLKWVSNCF